MYNETILEHFKSPHNAGVLLDASAKAEVTNPVCGDVLLLSVRVEGGLIAAAQFKVQGCVAAIAAGSVLTDLLIGRTMGEARRIKPQEIADALGGLPPATFHAAQLAAEAAAAVLKQVE